MGRLHTHFVVPGEPQGKARARTYYNPKAGHSVSHTPDNTVLYENLIKMHYQNDSGVVFGDVPLTVVIRAYFRPAKSTPKGKLSDMLHGRIFPTKKPDSDNIAKVVLDALNGLAYLDDKQVVHLEIYKLYGEYPRIEVEIETLEK